MVSVCGLLLALLTSAQGESPTVSTVSIVRSDDVALPTPVAPDSPLDYTSHIRPMVRRAVEQGGLCAVLSAARPGADGVVDVVFKVNIVHAHYERGDITDWRVVKALLEICHEWAPAARLTIAEGGVWIPPERQDVIALADFVEIGDGFETAGYRALLDDPDLAGADLRIVDLNYDEAVAVKPPGGGLVADSYWVPRTVLDAAAMAHPFEKNPADWGSNGEYGHYGMSNRTWLLKGPVPLDEETHMSPGVRPQPGEDGWSSPVYFHDDKIDLDRYYNDPTHSAVWAYAEFHAPRDEPAELWLGSDEGLTVWLDGEQVSTYDVAATDCRTSESPST
jgi:hypothetical protein